MTGPPGDRRWGGLTLAQWVAGVGALILAVTACVYAYHRGRLSGGIDAAQAALERRELNAKVTRLESQNAELNAKIAELEMARRLDREAYGQVERTLGDLQSRLSRQGDDLAFYRSIVSPEDGVQGLRIQRFDVSTGTAPREYMLRLTLIQAMRHESVAAGLAQITLRGTEQEHPAEYTVGQLIGRPQAQLPFSFRYFQTLEQSVTLPEGFEPFEATVRLRSGKLRAPMEQSFPWKSQAPPAA